ncbi:tyrosine-type recombinase/integrase [Tamlana sp. 2201CG12-4]|uniref:tyrosine-type recombinase/integrase n=1 Tax=Tamlana sp. 2201CG12-4 TaxID=3112582 RepID=UPI002DBA3E64|nr:tyrosine-type recombinase/integrase [Tamlana sp. 2201CG12-4]MEC3906143.1 tyrosine-type recombinase/integrase [Tamlana sp. 2201CG12-4]
MALKGQKTKSDFLEWDKMKTLVLKLERDRDYKFSMLISCGCYLGMRISDLLQLRWSDLLNKEFCELTEKKTKKHRKITINPELKEIVERIAKELNPNIDNYIFVNRFGKQPISVQYVNTKLKKIFEHYQIKGQYSSHFMRKSLGRQVWTKNNYSEQALILLSQLFNHSSIQTTKIYLGIRDEEISNLYLSV